MLFIMLNINSLLLFKSILKILEKLFYWILISGFVVVTSNNFGKVCSFIPSTNIFL